MFANCWQYFVGEYFVQTIENTDEYEHTVMNANLCFVHMH